MVNSIQNSAQLNWRSAEVPAELATALRALQAYFPQLREDTSGGASLRFEAVSAGSAQYSEVVKADDGYLVRYQGIPGALRGVGTALGGVPGVSEAPFASFGIMLDCSRNRVMTVEHLKSWLAKLARMGYNQVLL